MIDRFDGEYRFLSNFWPCYVWMGGERYPSVEHAYQAAKTLDSQERETIKRASTGEAKRLGKKVTLRQDWKDVRIGTMNDLLRQKFAYPDLKAKLKATAPHELIEGNWWGDTFWGMCKGLGENRLGKMLMDIRDGRLLTEVRDDR